MQFKKSVLSSLLLSAGLVANAAHAEVPSCESFDSQLLEVALAVNSAALALDDAYTEQDRISESNGDTTAIDALVIDLVAVYRAAQDAEYQLGVDWTAACTA